MAQEQLFDRADDFGLTSGGGGGAPDPEQFKAYLEDLRARLARGETIKESEIPLDYKVKTGQLFEKSWWEKNRADILGTAGIIAIGVGGGLIAGPAAAPGATAATIPTAGTLASTSTVPLTGALAPTVASSMFPAAAAPIAGASTLGKIGSMLGKAGVGTTAGGIGKAIGDAATAAGQNALDQEDRGLTANQENIYGQSAFETELMNRAKLEGDQRQGAAADIYRQSYVTNPRVSPFNPRGNPTYSPEYLASVSNLEKQGSERLATAPQYGTNVMDPLKPYTPIDIKDVQGATGTKPGTLQKVGTWLGPTLTVAEKIALGLM